MLTDPDLPSGSDRIMQALRQCDPTRVYDTVVNVQGDLPTLDPQTIRDTVDALGDADIATPVVEIVREDERTNPNVVKAVFGANRRALYFTRATAPTGEGPLYHHIGLYAYRRAALERFVKPAPGLAGAAGKVGATAGVGGRYAPSMWRSLTRYPSVLTLPADLERARAWYAAQTVTKEAP